MKQYKIVIFTLIMVLIGCKQEQKTVCEQFDEVDLEMLTLIDDIKKEYAGKKEFLKAFDDAQIYWIQYRNRQIKAIFPFSPKQYKYDVGDCKCEVYRELTEVRIKELRKWVEGVPKSEICRGSYKTN